MKGEFNEIKNRIKKLMYVSLSDDDFEIFLKTCLLYRVAYTEFILNHKTSITDFYGRVLVVGEAIALLYDNLNKIRRH